ncbi:hypothetical protein PRIPAC_96252 [Pristionchus pacificus]|uniref:ShK domain-containing protein n=1 Tax=Pristionchus pacificus TaxID=54126 RepID=A0A2A6D256_PRIPA|nr:hypothetical protein PRIPAC_96252 [Pristionchus pacificus]|eukprot:PDM84426.1 ShK domain-containing protein [Pristionchus pacificus]
MSLATVVRGLSVPANTVEVALNCDASSLIEASIMKFLTAFLAFLIVSIACAQEAVESTTEEVQSTTDGWEGIAGACVDAKNAFSGVSDCPFRISLCKLADHKKEMEKQCPKTCGFC